MRYICAILQVFIHFQEIMKFKQVFILCLLCLPAFVQAQIKTTTKGMRYQIIERKTPNPQMVNIGDYISLRLYTGNYKDSIVNKQSVNDVTVDPANSPIDIREVLPYLAVGDSAICYVKVDTFARYAGRMMPAYFPTGTDMKHYIRVVKAENAQAQREADKKIIEDYAKANNLKTMTTASGLHYVITQQGTGEKPKAGEKVTVHYRGMLLNGKQFDASYDRGQPFSFKLGKGQVIAGWDEGIALLNTGTKATFLIPSQLAYGKQGAGGDIPPSAVLRFDIELMDAPNEKKAIAEYLTKNNLKSQVTPSGLHYIIKQQGAGVKPAKGQTIVAHYKGTLLNGQEFDSSYSRNQPFEFQIGTRQVIAGWDEGFALMNVGTKAILVIPSELGYGSRGAGGSIPPDSTLVFEVELLEVK